MKFLRILFFVLSLTTTLVMRAYDFEANGLYFDIVSTADLTCALTSGPSGHKYTGALVIPDEVEYSGKKLKVVSVECRLPEVSSVKIGKNITTFYYRMELEIGCFSDNEFLTSVEWTGDMILEPYIFSGCTNLKSLSYKSICKEIPTCAFENCPLISIDLSTITSIRSYAFKGCNALNIIDLSSVQGSIYSNTFANCGSISQVIIGSNIDCIESCDAWRNCIIDSLVIAPSPNKLTIGTTTKKQSDISFISNKVKINGLYLGRETQTKTNISQADDQPFRDQDFKHVTVGARVCNLPSLEYLKYGFLTDYTGYFTGCQYLSSIIFEGNDITLGGKCFYDTCIKEIILPKGTNSIGSNAFPPCITSISFGSKIEKSSTIESDKLKQVSILANTPPTPGLYFSKEAYISANLLVPYGSKEAYKNTAPWKNFWNIEEMPGVETEKVEITPVNANLNVGDTLKLAGTKHPANSIDTIQWKSSDVKIATVSHDGLVTAVAPGKTTITLISGKATATCEVNVAPITAEKITLSNDKVSLNESDTITITATITPETTTDKTIKWSSSDEKIATVSKEGIVTAIGAGTATITATCGEISSSCEVTVYEPNIAIEVTDNTLSVIVEGSSDPVNISLFTVFGQCAYRQSVDASIVIKEKIDLSKLPSGTYIVQVISGTMNSSKRIVKS